MTRVSGNPGTRSQVPAKTGNLRDGYPVAEDPLGGGLTLRTVRVPAGTCSPSKGDSTTTPSQVSLTT